MCPDDGMGAIDVMAVGFYLSGVVLLFGIALLEAGLIVKATHPRRCPCTVLLIGFLIVAHIAMILGIANAGHI